MRCGKTSDAPTKPTTGIPETIPNRRRSVIRTAHPLSNCHRSHYKRSGASENIASILMINRPTVLILGAGASAPFGFPTGRKLLDTIVAQTIRPEQGTIGRLLLDAGFEHAAVSTFGQTLRFSQRNSVDAFLEHRGSEFLEVGKAAIAAALTPHEVPETLWEKGDWYRYLFNQLNCSFEEFDSNRLGIITFNYDRSLEQFLYSAFRHSYGQGISESAAKIKSIRIIHLHGSLGKLAELEPDGQPYHPKVNPSAIRERASQIKIIHETIDVDPQFQQAHQLLVEAQRVCFLGFGYDPVNLKRLLGHPNLIQANKRVVGSAMGFTPAEKQHILELFDSEWDLAGPDKDCLAVLRETGILFSH